MAESINRDSVRVLPKKVSWRRLMGLASRFTQLELHQTAISLQWVRGSYSSSAEDGLHAGATAAPCAHRRGMCGRDWRAHATKLRLAMCMTAEARDGMRRGTGSYLCIQTNTCDAAPMAATLRLATTPRAPPVPAPKCHSMHRSTICTSSPHASWASTFRSM